jgi:RNA polymerase sigma factor (sigma-70 family)
MEQAAPAVLSTLLSAPDPAARERAWTDFLSSYNRLIMHVCHRQHGNYDEVMDRYAFIVEQLRRDDLRRLRSFDAAGTARFTTWLTVVLRRLCLDHHRARVGRRQATGPEAEARETARRDLAELIAEDLEAVPLADSGPLPDAVAEASEWKAVLSEALEGLDPEDRLILAFRFEQELSVPEIARLTAAASPFHVYRRIDRILGQLRAKLERAGIGRSG